MHYSPPAAAWLTKPNQLAEQDWVLLPASFPGYNRTSSFAIWRKCERPTQTPARHPIRRTYPRPTQTPDTGQKAFPNAWPGCSDPRRRPLDRQPTQADCKSPGRPPLEGRRCTLHSPIAFSPHVTGSSPLAKQKLLSHQSKILCHPTPLLYTYSSP